MTDRMYPVNKNELISILEKNREKHIAAFKKGVVEYRKKAISALEKRISLAKENRKFDLHFDLPQPVNYIKEYDRILGLLAMTSSSEVEISAQEYSAYVLDEWSWRSSFFANTVAYYGPTGAIGPSGPTGPKGSSSDIDLFDWSDADE